MAKIIIFTDLDGTLLHPKTYSFEEARPALGFIKEKGIPLILCSSKTRAEMEAYRKRLDNEHPFVSENGGGIFIPKGYFQSVVLTTTSITLTPSLSQGEREEDINPRPLGEGGRRPGEGTGEEVTSTKAKLPPDILHNVRELRKNQTDAESLMWRLLRNRNLSGYKFRRQHPTGRYILDFYCDESKLAIELDGGGHAENERVAYDALRTKELEGAGIKVLRFWNNDVLQQTEAVLERIYQTIISLTPLTPALSQGEREGDINPRPLGEGGTKCRVREIVGGLRPGEGGEGNEYETITLGTPYKEIRKIFIELRQQFNAKIKGFGDMTIREVAALSGLTQEEAALAKEREFGEPFIFEGKTDEAFLEAIEGRGLHWTQGRFFHIMGNNDKGKAVNILKELYKKEYGEIVTIGLGDGFNDLPMLKEVDHPMLIPKTDGRYDERVDLPNLKKAKDAGPIGWNETVMELLKMFNLYAGVVNK